MAVLGLLVVTHGELALELVRAAQRIVGTTEGLEAVSIGWDDDVTLARRRIEAAIKRVDRGKGVLILTDMFGGTPSNVALSMLEPEKVEIVTGVNLPMVIKFMNHRDRYSLFAAAAAVAAQGRSSIHVASELLRHENDRAEADPR
jgi:PTS system mannose-specific IIA component